MAETPPTPRSRFSTLAIVSVVAIVGASIVGFVAALGFFAWRLLPERETRFIAEAEIVVVSRDPRDNAPDAPRKDFLAKHLTLLRSPIILERAVKRPNVRDIDSLAGVADPVDAVSSMIAVTSITQNPRGTMIQIKAISPVPGDSAVILDAIFESYKEYLAITFRNQETLEMIKQLRDTLKRDVVAAEKQLVEFRKTGTGTPFKKPIENRVAVLEQKTLDDKVRRAEIQSKLTHVQTTPDALFVKLHAHEWAAKSGFNALPEDVRKTTTAIEAYADHLKGTLASLEEFDRSIQELLASERKRLQDLNVREFEESRLRESLARDQKSYELVMKRFQDSDQEHNKAGFEAWMSHPKTRPARPGEFPPRRK